MSPLFSNLLAVLVSTSAFVLPHPPVQLSTSDDAASWHPQMGDHIVVDTKENQGYLVHPNGAYATFPLITGQNKTVAYIGRVYKATTPAKKWMIASKDLKGDRITFGPTGRFFRLFDEGRSTPYGFHEHREEEIMFAREDRFQSMGCIIVRSFVLDIIENTYNFNEGGIPVETVYGIEDPGHTMILAKLG